MSQSRYEYDENSETWPYFALTAILVPLIPSTISIISSLFKKSNKSHKSSFSPYNANYLQSFRNSQNRSKLFNLKTLLTIFGWILISGLLYIISNTETILSENHFDPWKILEISENATEKIIKTAYRKLSLKFHPDKVDTSSMTQEEIDSVDAAYVLINKAYKALTDETVRENFLKYGNPDGPVEIKHGIALPHFLIEGAFSPFLVVIYIAFIAIVLPLLVSNWWNGVKSTTKNGTHVTTADHFMKLLINASPTHVLLVDDIIKQVSHSVEYLNINTALTPDTVYSLIISYINRETCKDENLRLNVVAITPKLLSSFLEIAAAFKNTDYCLKIVDAHRSIIQALNIEKDAKHFTFKEILQLPGVDVSKIDTNQSILTLGKLLKNKTVTPEKFLNKDKVDTIINYSKKIPIIEPIECKFKVPGEDHLPPMSAAHVSLKFLIKSPAHKGKPDFKSFKEDVINNQFKEEQSMDNLKDPMRVVNLQPNVELLSIPPYFPDTLYIEQNSGWIALLVSQRDNKIIEAPKILNKADLSNIYLTQDEFMESKCNISTFKIQLSTPTPKEVGVHHFRLILRNLTYFGSDIDIPVVMNVEDKPIEKSKVDVYGIEDPDEDSIAGAMAQLRGESVKRVEFKNEYESSDDEDDEDNDDIVSWTDIDTDTEVEEDAVDTK